MGRPRPTSKLLQNTLGIPVLLWLKFFVKILELIIICKSCASMCLFVRYILAMDRCSVHFGRQLVYYFGLRVTAGVVDHLFKDGSSCISGEATNAHRKELFISRLSFLKTDQYCFAESHTPYPSSVRVQITMFVVLAAGRWTSGTAGSSPTSWRAPAAGPWSPAGICRSFGAGWSWWARTCTCCSTSTARSRTRRWTQSRCA